MNTLLLEILSITIIKRLFTIHDGSFDYLFPPQFHKIQVDVPYKWSDGIATVMILTAMLRLL